MNHVVRNECVQWNKTYFPLQNSNCKYCLQNILKFYFLKMLKRTIDGKTILLIEIERNIKRISSNENDFQLSSQNSNDLILEKKWMDKEELNEKHLMAAITNKETIPVPHIMEVDQSAYIKLYPENFKKSTWRILAEREY